MFGNNSSTGGSLFGANKPATGGFGAPASTSSGFSFGSNNNTAAPATSGGLFGNKPATTTQSGGLFGSTAPTSTAGTTTGGLFGSTNNTSTTNTTGGLFGNTAAKPAGGLFGSSTTSAPASTSGGLFGAASTTTQPTTGGLFGSNTTTQPATSTTGGLFGSSTTNTAQTATGGLFGSTATNTAQPTTGGLFGSSNTSSTGTGLFGSQQNAQQQQQQTQSLQPSSSQPAFAWSQQSLNNNQPQQQQQPLSFLSSSQDSKNSSANNNYSINIQDQLSKVKNSWDPTSQQTALKTYFYNTVPQNQSALYTKPANEGEDWDKAFENKPTPNSVPVRAVGFDDLKKRTQTQVNHVAQARVILQQISEKYKTLSDKHDLDTASRIVAAKARYARISRRILRLVSTLAVLKSKGYQLSPSEEKLIQQFQELLTKSQDPSGLGKSNELWARLSILKEKAKGLSDHLDNSLAIKRNDRDDSNDTEQTQLQILQIAKVLQEQQNGIKYLTEVLKEDEEILQQLNKLVYNK